MEEDKPITMELDFEDIEPMERELEKCYRHFHGGFLYKGVFWDWRCARNAVEDLKARRDYGGDRNRGKEKGI